MGMSENFIPPKTMFGVFMSGNISSFLKKHNNRVKLKAARRSPRTVRDTRLHGNETDKKWRPRALRTRSLYVCKRENANERNSGENSLGNGRRVQVYKLLAFRAIVFGLNRGQETSTIPVLLGRHRDVYATSSDDGDVLSVRRDNGPPTKVAQHPREHGVTVTVNEQRVKLG